jgi:hypothetical protein
MLASDFGGSGENDSSFSGTANFPVGGKVTRVVSIELINVL